MEIWGLVLAAGASTRFGRPKLVHPIGGEPLIRRSVTPLVRAGLKVIVVSAPAAGDIRGALGGLDVTVIENADAFEGVASSIRCGIRALPQAAVAAVILPGDQPDTSEALVRTLVQTFGETNTAAVSPRYRGTQGPPVLFARALFPSLLALEGDRGARAVLQANKERVVHVDLDLPMPKDVDTPEDLEALRSAAGPEA